MTLYDAYEVAVSALREIAARKHPEQEEHPYQSVARDALRRIGR